MSRTVTVVKLNIAREETWRYTGTVLRADEHSILIEAFFNRRDLPFHGITFAEGDRFVEQYFDDRWYNVFEIHDRSTDALKGWYCNVTYPAEISVDRIAYVDLALDLLVYPNGEQLILDRDEFDALALDVDDQKQALRALADLRRIFKTPKPLLV